VEGGGRRVVVGTSVPTDRIDLGTAGGCPSVPQRRPLAEVPRGGSGPPRSLPMAPPPEPSEQPLPTLVPTLPPLNLQVRWLLTREARPRHVPCFGKPPAVATHLHQG
jgi:hypothetical protein